MSKETNAENKDSPGICACCAKKDIGDDDDDGSTAKVFGEKGGYWARYNLITDKWDGDMMERLNRGLDNLLIFVSFRTQEEENTKRGTATSGGSLLCSCLHLPRHHSRQSQP